MQTKENWQTIHSKETKLIKGNLEFIKIDKPKQACKATKPNQEARRSRVKKPLTLPQKDTF